MVREGLFEKMSEERVMQRSGWQMLSAKEKSKTVMCSA